MKAWPKTLVVLLGWSLGCADGRAATNQPMEAAIQAIQQAPDPSAAVGAYANGFALDRNDSKLYEAYLLRMVELGLPELAYHQAQTLTTLQANNGLAWGVVAYVDARRAQMPDAVSAINLAGQFSPDSKFVQHTAGELLAWYDLKADKGTISESAKDGLNKVRRLLEQRPAFSEAYSTAQKAYQTQANPTPQPAATSPAPAAPAPAPAIPNAPQVPLAPQGGAYPGAQADQVAPLAYAAAPPPPTYYYPDYSSAYYPPAYTGIYMDWGPSYCNDWGVGWVAPSPWWWWQPCGFWGGCSFFPFGVTFAFGDFDYHHGHGGHDGHGGHSGHDGQGGHWGHGGHDSAYWHHDGQHPNSFFGAPTRASGAGTQWARTGSSTRSLSSATGTAGTSTHWWTGGAGQHSSLATAGAGARTQPVFAGNRSGVTGSRAPSAGVGGVASTRGSRSGAPASSTWAGMGARSPTATAPAARTWSGNAGAYRTAPTTGRTATGGNYYARSYTAPRSSWAAAPSYRAPTYTAPRYAAPTGRSSGWQGGASMSAAPRSSGGSWGAVRGGGSYSGGSHGGFSGGGSYSGGGHGGGFSGGGGGGGSHGGGSAGGGHGGGGGHR